MPARRSAPFGFEHARERIEMVDEALGFGAEVIASGRCKAVVARAASVLRDAPFSNDELPFLHAVKRLEQSSIVDENATGGLRFEPRGDLECVHRGPGERFENEDVEGAFEKRHGVSG